MDSVILHTNVLKSFWTCISRRILHIIQEITEYCIHCPDFFGIRTCYTLFQNCILKFEGIVKYLPPGVLRNVLWVHWNVLPRCSARLH